MSGRKSKLTKSKRILGRNPILIKVEFLKRSVLHRDSQSVCVTVYTHARSLCWQFNDHKGPYLSDFREDGRGSAKL